MSVLDDLLNAQEQAEKNIAFFDSSRESTESASLRSMAWSLLGLLTCAIEALDRGTELH